jgi:ParB family transcriptional regulator, chromosome partitioning protein
MAKNVLGRGLGSLIPSRSPAPAPLQPGDRVLQIALTEIVPSPLQPRREFRDEQLRELMESIREHGIIQPLVARRAGSKYQLIAGERRWRAATTLGLEKVPVIVRAATDQEVVELALIENLQRSDLNPIEEAHAYERLATEFKLTQDEIAKKVGRSRVSIANALRLLDLEPQVQSWLVQGRLSVGHAKVLLALKAPAEQLLIAEQALRQGATVRGTEKLVAAHLARRDGPRTPRQSESGASRPAGGGLSPALKRVEDRLRDRLATEVNLRGSGQRGTIEIAYYGADDLQRLLDAMGLGSDDD